MKKTLPLLTLIFLLNGCAESIALLGSGASNGRIVQSSLNSAISYGVKKQTGKTPLEHAIAYAEKKNPERMNTILFTIVEQIKNISILLNPIIPDATNKVLAMINISELNICIDKIIDDNILSSKKEIGNLDILFNKIEDDN